MVGHLNGAFPPSERLDNTCKTNTVAMRYHTQDNSFNVDDVPTNAPKQYQIAKIFILEDNEAVIKMV